MRVELREGPRTEITVDEGGRTEVVYEADDEARGAAIQAENTDIQRLLTGQPWVKPNHDGRQEHSYPPSFLHLPASSQFERSHTD